MASLVSRARAAALGVLVGLPARQDHTRMVAGVASAVAGILGVPEKSIVVAAAWLHDIGYAERIATTGFHPLDGAVYARAAGFPDQVVSLIAHHTGAAFEAAERGLSRELLAFDAPDAEQLDILTFADLTVGPAGERTTAEARIAGILDRYQPDHPVHRAMSRSALSLLARARVIEDRIAQLASD